LSSGIRIQSGKWKGRKLPIPPKVKGHSHFTPAIVKKSVFSTIEAWDLKGQMRKSSSCFIDLFAGSGQMGAEALSIGFQIAIFQELSQERFANLMVSKNLYGDQAMLLRKDGFRYHKNYSLPASIETLVYFIDPPYSFWQTDLTKIQNLIHSIYEEPEKSCFLIIQGPDKPILNRYPSKEFGANRIYVLDSHHVPV
jgi:16S rRNA (guanine966-N2)-methyltransferase